MKIKEKIAMSTTHTGDLTRQKTHSLQQFQSDLIFATTINGKEYGAFLNSDRKCRITFTNSALDQMIRLMFGKYSEFLVLRIGVQRESGCAGLKYQMTVDSSVKNSDEILPYSLACNSVDSRETKFIVAEKSSLLYLIKANVDYEGTESSRRFIFENPTASYVCGCGSSFTT